jgi:PIN domain nuclease of toxin-antitoxin system
MRYFLDTHAAYWAMLDSPRLSRRAYAALAAPEAQIFYSPVSAYELHLKERMGRIVPLPQDLSLLTAQAGYTQLPLVAEHMQAAARLPLINRDPWDRFIAAQAICEGLTVITRDKAIAALGASVLW